MIDLSPTVTLLELLVVILGIIGTPISLVMLAYIQGDRRNVRLSGMNGINKRLTNSDLRNELSRTYKLVCYTAMGIILMTLPNAVRAGNQVGAIVLNMMLLSWEVIAVLNSLWAFVDRRRNVESLRQLHRTGSEHEAENDEQDEMVVARNDARDVARDTVRDPLRDIAHDLETTSGGNEA